MADPVEVVDVSLEEESEAVEQKEEQQEQEQEQEPEPEQQQQQQQQQQNKEGHIDSYTFPDSGDVYSGEWLKDKRNGQGKLTVKASGVVYDGEWKKGVFVKGTATFPNGDKLEATFNNKRFEASGRVMFYGEDGSRFEGDYKKGQKSEGVMIYPKDSPLQGYKGLWKDNRWHGQGTLSYKDTHERVSFVGKFADGNFADGKLTYRNQASYSGCWDDDKPHGKGAFTYEDGHARWKSFQGTFKQGLHSEGSLTYADGRVFEGQFGAMTGYPARGVMTYSNGSSYDGFFNAESEGEQRHGLGTLTLSDGRQFTGKFSDNDSCSGKLVWPNGNTYEGGVDAGAGYTRQGKGQFQWKEDEKHRQEYDGSWDSDRVVEGVLVYVTGDRYTGPFMHGRYNGDNGELVRKHGETLKGSFEAGIFVSGTVEYANGDEYTGGMTPDEKKDGQGTWKMKDGREFTGEFKGGAVVSGVLTYGDPAKFQGRVKCEGEVADDLTLQGVSELTLESGDVYKGAFNKDAYHGVGVLTQADGTRFEGEWANGKKVKGTLSLAEKAEGLHSTYTGSFDGEGQYHGKGVLSYRDGRSFEGVLVNGKQTQGILTLTNGAVFEGEMDGEDLREGVFTFADGGKVSCASGDPDSFQSRKGELEATAERGSIDADGRLEDSLEAAHCWPEVQPRPLAEDGLSEDVSKALNDVQTKGGEQRLQFLQATRDKAIAAMRDACGRIRASLEAEATKDADMRKQFDSAGAWTLPESAKLTVNFLTKLGEYDEVVKQAEKDDEEQKQARAAAEPHVPAWAVTVEQHHADIIGTEQETNARAAVEQVVAKAHAHIKQRSELLAAHKACAESLEVIPGLLALEGGEVTSEAARQVVDSELAKLEAPREALDANIDAQVALLQEFESVYKGYVETATAARKQVREQAEATVSAATKAFAHLFDSFSKGLYGNQEQQESVEKLLADTTKYQRDRSVAIDTLAASLLSSALHEAVAKGDQAAVSAALNNSVTKLDADRPHAQTGQTALEVAVGGGRHEAVRALCKAKADCDRRTTLGGSYLALALSGGAKDSKCSPEDAQECFKALLDCGADINLPEDESEGLSLVHITARDQREDDLKRLLAHGCDINKVDKMGATALHHAAKVNCGGVMRELLKHGAAPNAMDLDGNTPLHFVQGVDLALVMAQNGARAGLKNRQKRVASSLGGKSLKKEEKEYSKLPAVPMDREACSEGSSGWRPDDASPGCDLCSSKFSMVNRRHHCRRCGLLVCGKCSNHNATQEGKSKKESKIRVCDPCFNQLRS